MISTLEALISLNSSSVGSDARKTGRNEIEFEVKASHFRNLFRLGVGFAGTNGLFAFYTLHRDL